MLTVIVSCAFSFVTINGRMADHWSIKDKAENIKISASATQYVIEHDGKAYGFPLSKCVISTNKTAEKK